MAYKRESLYILVIILVMASIVFRILNRLEFEQTSLLFVGIPTLITLMIIRYAKKPKTAFGTVFLTITLFLLMSGIVLGEGFICILIMAPIFYGVAAIVVAIYNFINKKNNKLPSFVLFPLLIILFQPSEFFEEKKIHTIKTTKLFSDTINISSLNTTPNFMKNLPMFFRIGFPKPIDCMGSGLQLGNTRTISFESSTKGVGKLVLEVAESTKNKVVFKIKSDHTHIHHWLTYKQVSVELLSTPQGNSIVWTTDFTCDLDPSWYFEEMEKYAVNLMNEHLIASYFNTDVR